MLFASSINSTVVIRSLAIVTSVVFISGCSVLGPQDSTKSPTKASDFPVYTTSAPTVATATPFNSPAISLGTSKAPDTHNSANSTPEATPALEAGAYQVESGDTLSGIAARFNITIADIRQLNPDQTDDNIFVGQILIIESSKKPISTTPVPTSPTATAVTASPTAITGQTTILYLVEPGDAAILIAEAFSITFDQLQALNPGVDLATIFIGQALNVPK